MTEAKPKCQICNDTGLTGWRKPMLGKDGATRMVFVPQFCQCEKGYEMVIQQVTSAPKPN